MEDPAMLVVLLKAGLMLVIVVATVLVVRELIPMMRGQAMPGAEQPKNKEP